MPDEDGNGHEASSASVSSVRTRPSDTSAPTSSVSAPRPPASANAPELPTTHDSAETPAETHDDTSESGARGTKAKSSETLRRSQACLACRKRKLRCDAKKPTCTRCEKAWLAYHPASEGASPGSGGAPPCEYDTSLLAKIFKKSSSEEGSRATSSQQSAAQHRDVVEGTRSEQLQEENEQLRAQISYLEAQLQQGSSVSAGKAAIRDDSDERFRSQRASSSTADSSRLSAYSLGGEKESALPPTKRLKASIGSDNGGEGRRKSLDASVLQPLASVARRGAVPSPPFYPLQSRTPDPSTRPHSSTTNPSVLSWTSSVPGAGTVPSSRSAPPPVPAIYGSSSNIHSPRVPFAPLRSVSPPIPSRQVLDQLINTCRHDSWLFSAVNTSALSDVVALSDAAITVDNDQLIAQALLSACLAIGLPLLGRHSSASGSPSSSILASVDSLLRSHLQPDFVSPDNPAWIPTVVKVYADGARDLLGRVQSRSAGFLAPATFIARLLLAEVSHAQETTVSAQKDLSIAAADARLLHLHSAVSGAHPRMSAGAARSSHLARALRGLMRGKEENSAFWCLCLQDCFQNSLSLLPAIIKRQGIQIGFPRQTDGDAPNTTQRDLDEVQAYLHRRRGLPLLEPLDNSMSLLVKASLVLGECCDYNLLARQHLQSAKAGLSTGSNSREQRGQAFVAAHESIRNSRMMLSQYDDRIAGGGPNSGNSRSREGLVQTLLVQDQLRFAAELTHHLAVLSLFETEIDTAVPSIQGSGEALGMISNAAVWLSRLAGMALQNAPLLCCLPSFCSLAWFVAARWLLYLRGADVQHYHADISTLVLLLSTRGERYGRDETYAKAIVALKREADFYGRICISPFTWPIEAISEFIPVQDAGVRSSRLQPAEPGFVSIATLAASVDGAAVLELADGG